KITIGLGEISVIDQIKILWPDGTFSKMENVQVDQLLTLDWSKSSEMPAGDPFFSEPKTKFFHPSEKQDVDFVHEENPAVDFDRDRLTFHMYSTEGPAFAKADVNGDGIEDVYFGGAKGFSGQLYFGSKSGKFRPSDQ